MDKPSSIGQTLLYGTIGALIAGLGFFPITYVVALGLNHLLFNILMIDSSSNTDDFMIVFICWLPAAILGAIGGLIGATLLRNRLNKVLPLLGAASGGMVCALVISLIMSGMVFKGWIEKGYQYRTDEMRPKADKPIHTLSGSYQELTNVSGYVESFAVSSDGHILAYAVNNQITLWDLVKKTELGQPLAGHTEMVSDMAFSPDGHWLVSGGYDQKAIIWSVPSGEQLYVLQGHQAHYIKVEVSPDNAIMVSGDDGGRIILWDMVTGHEVYRLNSGSDTNCLEFSSDGKLLAACTFDPDGVFLWDVTQHKPVGQLDSPNWSNGIVSDVAFGPGDELLAGAVSSGPVIWDMKSRLPLGAVQEISTGDMVDFSPDGRWIVSACDAMICLWDVSSRDPVGKLQTTPVEESEALFLPDGRLLAVNSHWERTTPSKDSDCDNTNVTTKIGIWTLDTP